MFQSLICGAIASVMIANPGDFEYPGANNLIWIQVAHQNSRPADTVIDTIMLHHTASSSLRGTVRWLLNPESRVSYHFMIGKDGSIVQHVSTFDRAWHAGASEDRLGRTNMNNFSIGIGIVNRGDGVDPYTEAQIEAVRHLSRVLIRRFPIRHIVSHEVIARPLGRKNDPKNYPWESLEELQRFGLELYY